MLVRAARLHAELRGDVEHAAAEADRDLRADDLADGGVFDAVPDHEADAHEVDEGAGDDEVLVVAGVLDE